MGDERLKYAARAGLYGLDPMRVLDEHEPIRQALTQALVLCADELRHEHDADLAVRIINQLGESLK